MRYRRITHADWRRRVSRRRWGIAFFVCTLTMPAHGDETTSLLEARLKDPNPDRRIDAALQIGRRGEIDLAPSVRAALETEANETVALAMVKSLLGLRDGESYEVLLRYTRFMDSRLVALEPVARAAPVATVRTAALSADLRVAAAAIRSLEVRAEELTPRDLREIAAASGRRLRESAGPQGELTDLASSLAELLRAAAPTEWIESILAIGRIPSEHLPWFAAHLVLRSIEVRGSPEEGLLLSLFAGTALRSGNTHGTATAIPAGDHLGTGAVFPAADPLAAGAVSLAEAILRADTAPSGGGPGRAPAADAVAFTPGSPDARAWSAACASLLAWAERTQNDAIPSQLLALVIRCPDRRLTEASGIAVAQIAGQSAALALIEGLADPTARLAARAGLLHLGSPALAPLTAAEDRMTGVQRVEAAMVRARIIASTITGGAP